jgi:hypothetical protein
MLDLRGGWREGLFDEGKPLGDGIPAGDGHESRRTDGVGDDRWDEVQAIFGRRDVTRAGRLSE